MKNRGLSPLIVIFSAIVLFILIKFIFIDIIPVKGHSMDPVLHEDGLIVVDRVAYGLYLPVPGSYLIRWAHPQRGEMIILKEPEEDKIIVKRCVGIPGDPVNLEDDRIRVAGLSFPIDYSDSLKFNLIKEVSNNAVFVIGDNTGNSIDSRDFGLVTLDRVLGKVIAHY
jgi:signal peptidase I